MPKLFSAALALALVALPLAAAGPRTAFARRIQETDEVKMCDLDKLNDSINKLLDDASCSTELPKFMNTIADDTLSSADQVKALDDFCASSCGKPFDAATIQWRDWCDANRDTFKPMDDMGAMGMNMGKSAAGHGLALYDADSLSGSILMMGCAKMNSTGPYCAAAFSDEDMADDAECDLSSSCCMGEMLEVVDFGDDFMKEMAEDCPNAAKPPKCHA